MDVQVGVFDFGSHRASPVVLLVDRRDDPVTPLLTQWTYQVGRGQRFLCAGGLEESWGLCVQMQAGSMDILLMPREGEFNSPQACP